MKEITAYECEHCNKLYKSKSAFNKHAVKHTEEMKRKAHASEKLHFARLNAESVDDFVNKVKQSVNEYLECIGEDFRLLVLDVDVRYSKCVSNTHCAPIGQVTNWYNKNDLPNGYIGFVGRVHIEYSSDPNLSHNFSGSRLISERFLHTGSGGYQGTGANGEYKLGYDCRFFLDDLPKLKEKVVKYFEEQYKLESLTYECDNEVFNRQSLDTDMVLVQESILKLEKELKKLQNEKQRLLDEYRAKSSLIERTVTGEFGIEREKSRLHQMAKEIGIRW